MRVRTITCEKMQLKDKNYTFAVTKHSVSGTNKSPGQKIMSTDFLTIILYTHLYFLFLQSINTTPLHCDRKTPVEAHSRSKQRVLVLTLKF